jgi:hypothetical protein
MKTRLSLLILFSSLFASFAGAKRFDGLVIPNGEYRTLPIAILVTPNTLGLGEDDVYRAVKLRFLANKIQTTQITSIKEFRESGYFVAVVVNFTSEQNIFSTSIELKKDTRKNLKQVNHWLGTLITPEQDSYGGFGMARTDRTVIDSLNVGLDKFLLDYLESNVEVEKLRENLRKLEEEGKLE